VIRAEVSEAGVALVGHPDGAVAYVDREWLPVASGPVPALLVSDEGRVAWCDWPPEGPQQPLDPDVAAARSFLALARGAAGGVAHLPAEAVEITGSGLVAELVRLLVGDAATPGGNAPSAVVDTTGDPAVIADATRRTADLGVVVLAGETGGRRLELDLYLDVHGRGLTLLGVGPPGPVTDSPDAQHEEPLLALGRTSLVRAEPGQVVAPDGAWYRVPGS
jgi:hypothetical protein